MKIHELHYSNTNTYLIEGTSGKLLFDTGWAGTFPLFCKTLGELKIPVQEIRYILISHYHPDHMGIAGEIAKQGAVILVPDLQKDYVHSSDDIFAKDAKSSFLPIEDAMTRLFPIDEGRRVLSEIGLAGEIIHTPGHSEDSISLWLDEGMLFVGDLNPLYELELHKGTQIEESWNRILARNPKKVYYGHARTYFASDQKTAPVSNSESYDLVSKIVKYIEKGFDISKIHKKTGADESIIEDVMRMYLTHQNIGVQGILDRIDIKNK